MANGTESKPGFHTHCLERITPSSEGDIIKPPLVLVISIPRELSSHISLEERKSYERFEIRNNRLYILSHEL